MLYALSIIGDSLGGLDLGFLEILFQVVILIQVIVSVKVHFTSPAKPGVKISNTVQEFLQDLALAPDFTGKWGFVMRALKLAHLKSMLGREQAYQVMAGLQITQIALKYAAIGLRWLTILLH